MYFNKLFKITKYLIVFNFNKVIRIINSIIDQRYIYCIFYQNEPVYTARRIKINFKCGPQVEKHWACLIYYAI